MALKDKQAYRDYMRAKMREYRKASHVNPRVNLPVNPVNPEGHPVFQAKNGPVPVEVLIDSSSATKDTPDIEPKTMYVTDFDMASVDCD